MDPTRFALEKRVVTGSLVFEGGGRVQEYVGGYSDWRLPTLAELVNLRVQDCNSSEPPSCLTPLFTAPAWGLPATTWTSTSSNTDPGSAWFVSTSSETAESEGKTVHNFVRAVRNIQ